MKYHRILGTLALAASLSLLSVVIPTTPALAAPVITLSPIASSVGAEVTVSGSNFSSYAGDNISVLFNGTEIKGSPLTMPAAGSFSITFKIPDDTEPGTAYITVKDSQGNQLGASASLTVWEPEIRLDTSAGTVGTSLIAEGKGFYAGQKINLYFDETEIILGSQLATRTGEYSFRLTIPESPAGKYRIIARNAAGNSALADFEVIPSLTLTPTSGAAGDIVTASGTGFGYRERLTITLDDDDLAADRADKNGSFTATFTVPLMPPGTYQVKAEDNDKNTGRTDFIISAAARLNPLSGNIGTELTVSGTGFIIDGIVTIKYDGSPVATTTTDNKGTFATTFKAPPSPHGPHSITASDDTNTSQFTFAMEATPPPVPALLVPADTGKAKATAYFNWEEVTDPSGVTYTLQIARHQDFTDTAMVLEKPELTESDYRVTPEEKLEPTKSEAPYYWRIRAIDNAANESQWSTPASFHIGFSWTMPRWLLYFLIAIGVLGISFFSFWMGRRTAYYRMRY